MYLKEIRAHGFKSFADKIRIELNKDITGIVGPNGSGKSNVVDAIRWVLGEQSVKSLRGDGNMTDVIFSGSKTRNQLNVASVSLVFDNADHYLPLEYDEISIKRRLYKDGTNEYFINNEKCRLKDITDLLMDSGIGKESFNIISQGKIEEILSNKPDDRRIIFEEAAGVLKYKKRKEDALRKLERTHNNMSRVDDIINELEVQVEPLKEQKEKALAY
ncbi:MAG: AAA family ATPase, partial [Bacilli bacterium]|nr:AAA family ATPase [Bacilli bacterium]